MLTFSIGHFVRTELCAALVIRQDLSEESSLSPEMFRVTGHLSVGSEPGYAINPWSTYNLDCFENLDDAWSRHKGEPLFLSEDMWFAT